MHVEHIDHAYITFGLGVFCLVTFVVFFVIYTYRRFTFPVHNWLVFVDR